MRIMIVSMLAALLLVVTASLAIAQEPADPGQATEQVAQDVEQAGPNTDWIQTVGILGFAGVLGLRGFNWVRRSRQERRQSAILGDEPSGAGDAF